MAKPKRIVLLSCVATKLPTAAPAKELYISPLFKKSLAYAEMLDPDDIVILSAKHYVLPLDKVISPYNKTLLDMPSEEIQEWAVQVLKILADNYDLENDQFIILAGDKYRKYLVPQLSHWVAPLKGLRIGQQLSWYSKKLAKVIKEGFIKLINLFR
jgi:hypothetical protein